MLEIIGVDTGERWFENVADVFDIINAEDSQFIRNTDSRLMDRFMPEFAEMYGLHNKSTRFWQIFQKIHPHCHRAGAIWRFWKNVDMLLSGALQSSDKCLFTQRIQRAGKIPIAFMQKIVCAELTDRILIARNYCIELLSKVISNHHRSADRLAAVRPDRIDIVELIA